MKVKVGNTIFDGEFEPVMVILSDLDKQNIANMAEDATRYARFPDEYDKDSAAWWIQDDTYWRDAPYKELAEVRVLESKIKLLLGVIRSYENVERQNTELTALRVDELKAKGFVHPDQKCPCVLALRYCTGDPCENCDC